MILLQISAYYLVYHIQKHFLLHAVVRGAPSLSASVLFLSVVVRCLGHVISLLLPLHEGRPPAPGVTVTVSYVISLLLPLHEGSPPHPHPLGLGQCLGMKGGHEGSPPAPGVSLILSASTSVLFLSVVGRCLGYVISLLLPWCLRGLVRRYVWLGKRLSWETGL